MEWVKDKIKAWFNIESGEGRLAALMVLYNFLLLVTLYLLKPVRDSLFLIELGPQQLPFVFILIAFTVIPISMIYSRFSSSVSLGLIINGVTLLLAGNLILIWWLLGFDSPVIYYILYVWVGIYSVLVTSQFWLLANALFNALQAKRLFNLLGLAAIAGAIAGGEITGLLVKTLNIEAQNLLLIGAGVLLSTLIVVRLVQKEARWLSTTSAVEQEETDPPATKKWALLRDILQSRHLLMITGIIAISVITTTFIDYQFKTIAAGAYRTDDSLTIFMGRFYGRVSIIALLLQFFVSSRFIQRNGAGKMVVILPSVLLLGAAGFFLWPVLATIVILRGADQSIKHSLDRTGRELLFVPVELDLKRRTKVFIDLFVDNGAQGLAGLFLILLTLVFSISVEYLTLVVIGLLACWIILAVLARRSYINEFRESIEEQVHDPVEDGEQQVVLTSYAEVMEYLRSREDKKIIIALDHLENGFEDEEISPNFLVGLLSRSNSLIRKKSLKVFRSREINGFSNQIAGLLNDLNEEVRLEAARYIYQFYDREMHQVDRLEIIRHGLHHDDARIQAVTLGLIAKDGGEEEKKLLSTQLLGHAAAYEGEAQDELKLETARVLGVAYTKDRADILEILLHSSSENVVKQAILSAGKTGDRQFVQTLISYLDSDVYRRIAQRGLAAYGEKIFGTLYDCMMDENIPISKRMAIPAIFHISGGKTAIYFLQVALDKSKAPVRHEIIRALNRMRQIISDPNFNKEKLINAAYRDARRYALFRQARSVLNASDFQLELLEVLDSEAKKSFESLFRLLGLLYNANDIYNAYKGIVSGKPSLVSNGIEFLENLLDWEIKRFIQPIFNDVLSGRKKYTVFDKTINNKQEAIQFLKELEYLPLEAYLDDYQSGE